MSGFLLVLALAGGHVASASELQPELQNIPGRDAAVVLCDLGKGKAALYTFVTVGQASTPTKAWSGRLPVRRAKMVAGDFNVDGHTDALVLLSAGKTRSKLILFTSDGAKLTPGATWTSKPGQIVWKSASLAVGRFNETETDCALLTCRLKDGKTVVYAFQSAAGGRLTGRCLLRTPRARLAANSQIVCGDVDSDLRDEAVIFSPAGRGGSLHVYDYDGTALNETTSTAIAGQTVGARLACGDVDGDGRDEPLLLARSRVSTTLTAFSFDGETISASPLAVNMPFAKTAQIGTADMNGDGRADPVAFTPRGKRRGSFSVGLSGPSGIDVQPAWSGAMRTAGARFACAPTLPTIVKDDVEVLPQALSAAVMSISDDQTTIVFAGAPAAVTDLLPGDVLILEPGGLAPKGIFRVVDEVRPAIGGTAVRTSEAGLQDVFAQAEIRLSFASAAGAGSGARRGDHAYEEYYFTLPVPLDYSAELGDAGSIRFGGEMKVRAGLAFWADISWTHIWAGSYFLFRESFTPPQGRHSVEIDLKKTKSVKATQDLDGFTLGPFMIGPVPLWVDTSFALEEYAEAKGSFNAWVDFEQNLSFRVGAQYDGHWSNLSASPDPGYKENGVVKKNGVREIGHDISGEGSARVGVRVKASALLWSVIGPTVASGPYVRARISSTENPAWGAYAGLDASVGLELAKVYSADFATWTLFEWPLIEAPVDPSKPLTDFCAPSTQIAIDVSGWVKPEDGGDYVQFPFRRDPNTSKTVLAGTLDTLWRVDGGPWTTCFNGRPAGPHKAGLPARLHATVRGAGAHKLDFYTKHVQGGRTRSEVPKTVTVRIDPTPPTVKAPDSDANLWHTSAIVPVTGADAGGSGLAGISYEVLTYGVRPARGSPPPPAWYPATLPPVSDGSLRLPADGVYKIKCAAADNAGNLSAPATWYEKVDSRAPQTGVTGSDALWHQAPVTVTFGAADAGADMQASDKYWTYTWTKVWLIRIPWPTQKTFSFNLGSGVAYTEYSLDNGKTWIRGTSTTIATPGDNTVLYRSADAAGNVEASRECHVKIAGADVTPPITTCSPDPNVPDYIEAGGPPTWVREAGLVVTFSASDPGSGVARTEYRVQRSTGYYADHSPIWASWGAWTPGTTVTLLPDPFAYRLEYRSIDGSGNVEPAKAFLDLDSGCDYFAVAAGI